jgi:intein/homing endonuclease
MTLRSTEYIRGYFDGEGCIHFRPHPSKVGRVSSILIDTCDLEVMRDIYETIGSWGIKASIYDSPTTTGRPGLRIQISNRAGMVNFLNRVRPLSTKHETRLGRMMDFWADMDRRAALLLEGERRVALEGGAFGSRSRIARELGLRPAQLGNRIWHRRARVTKLPPVPA